LFLIMKDIPVCLSVEGAYRLVNEDLWLCGTLAYESSGFRGILELAPHLDLRLGASYIIHDIQADQNPICRLPYMSPRGVEDKIGPRIDLALRSEILRLFSTIPGWIWFDHVSTGGRQPTFNLQETSAPSKVLLAHLRTSWKWEISERSRTRKMKKHAY
jgi:hypothetical protein